MNKQNQSNGHFQTRNGPLVVQGKGQEKVAEGER